MLFSYGAGGLLVPKGGAGLFWPCSGGLTTNPFPPSTSPDTGTVPITDLSPVPTTAPCSMPSTYPSPPPRGYLYAGLEFGAECYCGHKVQAPNASESECNMECKGERSSTCGGANRLSIYRLELAQESARRCKSMLPENGDPIWGSNPGVPAGGCVTGGCKAL